MALHVPRGVDSCRRVTKPLIEISQNGSVTIAVLKAGPWHGSNSENVLTWALLEELDALLDVVERTGSALVITSRGKWFCNGLDMSMMARHRGQEADQYIEDFYRLLARFLVCPVPIVAAINGHAFAGGFLLAMSCDYRVMTDGMGLLCMPEVDMAGEVQPGRFLGCDQQMLTVLQNKLPPLLVRDIMLQGRRISANEAQLRTIIDQVAQPDEVLATAIQMAKRWGAKPPGVFGVLKKELSRPAVAILDPSGESLSTTQGMLDSSGLGDLLVQQPASGQIGTRRRRPVVAKL